MGRERPYRSGLTAPATVRRKLIKRDKPSYKVILEQVTQQKKKLITVVCDSEEPYASPSSTHLTFTVLCRDRFVLSRHPAIHSYLQETHKSPIDASNLQDLMVTESM